MAMKQQARPKTEIVLMPQYVRKFTCVGSECEDTCCQGWAVPVDEETYKKYQRVRDLPFKSLMKQNIGRVRSNASSQHYAKIRLDAQGKCPFLSDEQLCLIQLRLGEDYLSDTCRFYPRIRNRVNGMLEISATMSCPEIARLALLNPNLMEFDEVEQLVENRGMIQRNINTMKPSPGRGVEKYFWELRIFTIQVLQNRRETLADRLLFLGLFYQKVQQLIEARQYDDIPETIRFYSRLLEQGGWADLFSKLPQRTAVQMTVLKKIAEARLMAGVDHARYIQCYEQFMQGLEVTQELLEESEKDMVQRYETAYRDFYEPFMREHEYILENYLVNYVFMNLFPFGKYESVFAEYAMLVLHYALIKMHLIGMGAYHKGLTAVLVLKLISSFSRVVEHHPVFLQTVYLALKENQFVSLPYMVVLIKNE